jgi:hypothetical protein
VYSRRHFLGAIGVPAVGAFAAPTLVPSKATRALEAAASVEASGLTPQEVASDESFWFAVQQAYSSDRSLVNLNY